MRAALHGEILRMLSTRLPLWTLLAALVCGGGVTGVLALLGPENAEPPLPPLDTAEGAASVLGLGGLLLFVPALLGTVAVTGEYRHRTIGTTFLAVPRRGTVMGAKLAVFALLGLAYGVLASVSSGAAALLGAAVHGQALGLSPSQLLTVLGQLTLASVVHMLLGVGIGALARRQLLAIGVVLGYFYLVENMLLLVPGLKSLYPYLPGGATASLTRFSFLTEAMAERTSTTAAPLASPLLGGLILLGYASVASAAAVFVTLRRDLA